MCLVTVNALVISLPPLLLNRFGPKLRTLYGNIHQTFLILTDLVLDACHVNPKENFNYILLRKIVSKKLKHRKAQRLTSFRQNNEVNFLILKKICRSNLGLSEGDYQKQMNSSQADMSGGCGLLAQAEFEFFLEHLLEILKNFEDLVIENIFQSLETIIKKPFKHSLSSSKRPTSAARTNRSVKRDKSNTSVTLGRQESLTKLGSKVFSYKDMKRNLYKDNYLKNAVDKYSSSMAKRTKVNLDSSGSRSPQSNRSPRSPMDKSAVNLRSTKEEKPIGNFLLPETQYFLLSNSIECNSGVTNINNNINIFSNDPQKIQEALELVSQGKESKPPSSRLPPSKTLA